MWGIIRLPTRRATTLSLDVSRRTKTRVTTRHQSFGDLPKNSTSKIQNHFFHIPPIPTGCPIWKFLGFFHFQLFFEFLNFFHFHHFAQTYASRRSTLWDSSKTFVSTFHHGTISKLFYFHVPHLSAIPDPWLSIRDLVEKNLEFFWVPILPLAASSRVTLLHSSSQTPAMASYWYGASRTGYENFFAPAPGAGLSIPKLVFGR